MPSDFPNIVCAPVFPYPKSLVREAGLIRDRTKKTSMRKGSKTATRCVHTGSRPDEKSGGLITPLHVSTAHRYMDHEGLYPRYLNVPNQLAAAEKIASLEGADRALVFSSGLAAISSVLLSFLSQGDHAIFQRGIYGGTHHFIQEELPKLGIGVTFWDPAGSEKLEDLINERSKLVYIETPSNPLMEITDLQDVARVCQEHSLLSVMDNTFATPIWQRPLEFRIDLVLHSGTKYLGGHSDISCGAVAGRAELMETVEKTAINFGGIPDARTCHLLERSLKTLQIRVEKQSENAAAIAECLQSQSAVERVLYPGLKGHPGHETARVQMSGFGAMLAFELGAEGPGPEHFQKALKIVTPALSLGGVESSICSPAATSHSKLSPAEREKAGISDRLLRLSVGIEAFEDLRDDLLEGLQAPS